MQVVIDALNWICGLGPMCMMPIIMFVIGICLRVKIGTLLKCCITTGVGFCGVNLVINTSGEGSPPSVPAWASARPLRFQHDAHATAKLRFTDPLPQRH